LGLEYMHLKDDPLRAAPFVFAALGSRLSVAVTRVRLALYQWIVFRPPGAIFATPILR
jgi:hypothetical protein